ncbi:MAG: tyrosine-protein phosphatase, partial [Planctomycetota bacterium]
MAHSRTIRFSDLKQLFVALVVYIALVAVLAGYYLVFVEARGNLQEVVSQKVYRSAQPSPEVLKRWVQQYNIRTIINLRGDAGKVVEDERKLADQLGIVTISISFSAYRLPSTDSLAKLIRAIETAELPLLIHCFAGVDRTGTASTLAAMAIGKVDY